MSNSVMSLFELKSFKLAFWAPIILSLLVVIYIVTTSQLDSFTGYKGLNFAFEIFKVPLAIFSLIFPSVALVTANHRSIQSKKQIEITLNQNRLSTRPHLSDEVDVRGTHFKYSIINKGVGFAQIDFFHIYWDELLVNRNDFENKLSSILTVEQFAEICSINVGGIIVMNGTMPVINIDFDNNSEAVDFRNRLSKHLRFEISYKSMYDDVYLLNGTIVDT